MITAKGVAWTATGAGLVLLGTSIGSTPLVLLGSALGLHVAVAWALLGRPHITGSLAIERHEVVEKNRLRVDAIIENGSRRPILARYKIGAPGTFEDPEDIATGSAVLQPGQQTDLGGTLVPLLHGAYQVGPLEVLIEDPAGLVSRELTVAEGQRLLAFPQTEEIRDLPLSSRMVTPYIGAHEVQQPGDGFEFYALRQYESGDSIRSINWRASARTDELIVNQRVKESFASVNVLVDGRAGEKVGIRKHAPWYRNARAGAGMAVSFMKARDQVTFHLATDDLETIKPKTPTRQRKQILELLAANDPHGEMSLEEKIKEMVPQLRPRSLFILVSSLENEPGVADALKQLRVREIPVLVITPGSKWPDPDDPVAKAATEAHEAGVEAARRSGARVVEWEPDQLLEVTMREVLYA